jgi:hypothetical protein
MDIFQAEKETMFSNGHFSGCFFQHFQCRSILFTFFCIACLKRKHALLESNMSGIKQVTDKNVNQRVVPSGMTR